MLAKIFGTTLTNGAHVLHLKAMAGTAASSMQSIAFTLDTTAPTVLGTVTINGGLHSGRASARLPSTSAKRFTG